MVAHGLVKKVLDNKIDNFVGMVEGIVKRWRRYFLKLESVLESVFIPKAHFSESKKGPSNASNKIFFNHACFQRLFDVK